MVRLFPKFQNDVLLRTANDHSSHHKNDNWVDSTFKYSMYQMQTKVDQISGKLWTPIRQPTRFARFFTPRASECVCPVTTSPAPPPVSRARGTQHWSRLRGKCQLTCRALPAAGHTAWRLISEFSDRDLQHAVSYRL